MAYSPQLIAKVKKLFPNSTEMHRLADNGGVMLGRYLDDSASNSIPINDVLLATSLEQIQKQDREAKERVELYREWCLEDPRK